MPRTLFNRRFPPLLLTRVAFGLRTRDLAARPMHADEANQAVKAGELLESGRYAYDPQDHHGPTLYYGALAAAWCRASRRSLPRRDDGAPRTRARRHRCVYLLGVLAFPSDARPALAAAAFLAASPPAVYYSRYFIQETLLATFTLAALVAAHRWAATARTRWCLAAGAPPV